MVKKDKKKERLKRVGGWLLFVAAVAYMYSPLTDDYNREPGRQHTRLYFALFMLLCLITLGVLKIYEFYQKRSASDKKR